MDPLMKQAYGIVVKLVDLVPEEREARLDELRRSDNRLAECVALLLAEYDSDDEDSFEPILKASPSSPSAGLNAGDRIGNYELISLLGQGGQGRVFLAQDLVLGRSVALKLLPPWSSIGEKAAKRLKREAAIASKLQHPGICSVYELGEYQGLPFLVMQFVEGQTLQERLRDVTRPLSSASAAEKETKAGFSSGHASRNSRSKFPAMAFDEFDALLDFFIQAARALHEAHEAGLVHRDVKPANIMISEAGQPVILDFGLAREEGSDDGTLTETGDVMGTPTHMSPEQLSNSKGVDRRTDIWALGVTLYQCLTLNLPFIGATREALLRAIRIEPAESIRVTSPRFPKDLDVVVATAIEKDPNRRYETAEALARDLAAVRDHRVIQARPVTSWVRTARWARRRPALATLILALVIAIPALAGLGGFLYAHLDDIEAQEELQLKAEVETILDEAFFELTEGDKDESAAKFDLAAEKLPASAEAAAGKVLARIGTGDRAGARAILLESKHTIDDDDAFNFLLAETEGRKNAEDTEKPASPLAAFVCGSRIMMQAEEEMNQAKAEEQFLQAYRHFRAAVLGVEVARRSYYFMALHALGHVKSNTISDSERRDMVAAVERIWPDHKRARYWCSFALVRKDIESSLDHLLNAHANAPPDSNVLFNIIDGYTRLRNFDKAAEYLSILADNFPESMEMSRVLFAQGKIHDGRRETAKALECCRRALEKSQSREFSADVESRIAGIHWYARQYKEAAEHARKALLLNPNLPHPHLIQGNVFYRQKNYDAALQSYRSAIIARPGFAPAWKKLLQTLTKGKDSSAALIATETALEKVEDSPDVLHQCARIFMRDGQEERAIQCSERAAALAARDPMMMSTILVFLEHSKLHESADRVFDRLSQLKSEHPDFHYAQGFYLTRRDRNDEAVESFEKAIKANPRHRDSLLALAHIMRARGDLARTDLYLKMMGRAAPRASRAYMGVAQDCNRFGRIELAEDFLKKSIELEKNWAFAHFLLGQSLRQQGRFDEFEAAMAKGAKAGRPGDKYVKLSQDWLSPNLNPKLLAAPLLSRLKAQVGASSSVDPAAIRDTQESLIRLFAVQDLSRLWGDLLAEDPTLARKFAPLAAEARILAAVYPRASSAEECRARRQQARAWLEESCKDAAVSTSSSNPGRDALLQLATADSTATVREESYLRLLDDDEAQSWRDLWASIRNLRP